MPEKLPSRAAALAALFLAATLAACGGGDDTSIAPLPATPDAAGRA